MADDTIRLSADFSGVINAAEEVQKRLAESERAAEEYREAIVAAEKADQAFEESLQFVEQSSKIRHLGQAAKEAADRMLEQSAAAATTAREVERNAQQAAEAARSELRLAQAHEQAARAAREQAQAEAEAAQVAARAAAQVDAAMDAQVRGAMAVTTAQRESRVGIVADQAALRAALDQTTTTMVGAGMGGKGGMAGAALQVSYAFQDFTSVLGTQGFGRAIASVQNNLPLILMYLGAGMGLTGVVSGAAVATGLLVENWDKLDKFFGAGKALEAIPQTTDRVQALTEAIHDQAREIEELRKKRELDMEEMRRYRELTARLAGDQDKLATARAARSVRGETDESRKYGAAFRKSVAERGGSEQLLDELVALGVDETTAERMIEAALLGSKSDINAIMRRTVPLGRRAFQNFWAPNDPVAIQEAKAREKKGKEFDKRDKEAEEARKKAEREKVEGQKQRAAHDIAEAHAAFAQWKKDHPEPKRGPRGPALGQMLERQRVQFAGERAARLARQSGYGIATPQQVNEMGQDVLKNLAQGMNQQAATEKAVLDMLHKLRAMAASYRREMQMQAQATRQVLPMMNTQGWQ